MFFSTFLLFLIFYTLPDDTLPRHLNAVRMKMFIGNKRGNCRISNSTLRLRSVYCFRPVHPANGTK